MAQPVQYFNIRLFQKAFGDGVFSFGRGVLTCPYPHGSMENKEWHRGFNTAYFENLKGLNVVG